MDWRILSAAVTTTATIATAAILAVHQPDSCRCCCGAVQPDNNRFWPVCRQQCCQRALHRDGVHKACTQQKQVRSRQHLVDCHAHPRPPPRGAPFEVHLEQDSRPEGCAILLWLLGNCPHSCADPNCSLRVKREVQMSSNVQP